MTAIDFICRNYVTIVLCLVVFLISFFYRKRVPFKTYVVWSIIALVLTLSILTYIEWGIGNYVTFTSKDILARKILSFICYIIRPTIIYAIMLISIIKTHKQAILFGIPWFINLALYQTCFYSNIVFTIDQNNHFIGGVLDNTCFIVSMVYLVSLLGHTFYNYRDSNRTLFVLLIVSYFICLMGIILDSFSGEYSILCNIIMICVFAYVLFSIFEMNSNQEREMYENIAEQKRLLMLSQIQPHFVFNTLNTIYYLCKSDPKLASEAVKNFSDYLRANMDGIDKKDSVPVLEEIKHAQAYVNIEKLRFDNIEVVFDIKETNFKIPALTIQPLVENAIKHGVKNIDNGIIKVSTSKVDNNYFVIVEDNGVGFNTVEKNNDGKNHIGLKNVIERVEMSGKGHTLVESEVNKGTKVTIMIKGEE